MLKRDEFVDFILSGSKAIPKEATTKADAALPDGFEGFDTSKAVKKASEPGSSFVRRLLEASDFGYPDVVQKESVIRSSDAVARYLPDRVSFWPKSSSRSYQTLLFEADITHKDLLAIPAFKGRKMSHLDIVEDALARMVSEALAGFQKGGESVTADVRKGKSDETLCIVSIKDERDQEPVRLICFGTENAKTGGLETFHLTEQTKFWDQKLAREHLELLYERQFKKLASTNWQEAFTTTEERKQAEKLLGVCSKKAPSEKDIQESVITLLETIAKSFGLRCKPGQPRRLQAFDLPAEHDIGIDPEERETKHGGRNPFGGVTLRDERNRLLGYIVYPLKTKEDASELRKYLAKNNRFHNVLVVFPEGEDTTVELWQGTDPLIGKLRKGKGFKDAAEVVSLLSRFFVVSKAKVRNPTELAQELAFRARYLRRVALKQLAEEPENGMLRELYNTFTESIIHDQTEDQFADAFAQTITNGMLAARWTGNEKIQKEGLRFTRNLARDLIPTTNPFLRELFTAVLGLNLDEQRGRFLWLVDDIADLLDRVDVGYVFGEGDVSGDVTSDPVIHFYEPFLAAYDKGLKRERGVFYTPRPVVSFIVHSVDELLRTEFGLLDGLADTISWGEMTKRHNDLTNPEGVSPDQDFIQILDPATGTGTFIVEVIDLIHKTLVAKWKTQGHNQKMIDTLWNEYVPKHLLTRLCGYELLMAPYAIAHLKIGLKLYETGYHFGSNERVRVYLTNALEPAQDFFGLLEFAVPALAHEAKAVNTIKRHTRFTVVIGNPPYSALSANLTTENRRIVDRYRHVNGIPIKERSMLQFEKNIQDDYIKFFAIGQSLIEKTRIGVLGYITNHSYLDGPTLRGMRSNLLTTFSSLRLLDIHGNTNKKENEHREDENVFDIQQGVAVALLSKQATSNSNCSIGHLWGTRAVKYEILAASTFSKIPSRHFVPDTDNFYFIAFESDLRGEYSEFLALPSLLRKNLTGTTTGFDALLMDFNKDELKEKLERFADRRVSESILREEYEANSGHSAMVLANRRSICHGDWKQYIKPFQLFPFDFRWVFLKRSLLQGHRFDVMENLADGKPGLIAMRQTKESFGVFATKFFCGHKLLGSYDRNYVFPLYDLSYVGLSFLDLRPISDALKRDDVVSEIEVFHYAYAVFHSPGYRNRYAEFLKIDFPRLPLTGSLEVFRSLASLGGEIVALHLLESPKIDRPITRYLGAHAPEIEKVSWSNNTVWLDKAQTTGFKGVREDVWNFHIGGYQVCEKWLKDRKGRTLSEEDIAHYQKIIVAISETIRIMQEIDEVIEKHGGWPGAFQTKKEGDA